MNELELQNKELKQQFASVGAVVGSIQAGVSVPSGGKCDAELKSGDHKGEPCSSHVRYVTEDGYAVCGKHNRSDTPIHLTSQPSSRAGSRSGSRTPVNRRSRSSSRTRNPQ